MIVRKDESLIMPILCTHQVVNDIRDTKEATWKDVVAAVLEDCGTAVPLSYLYDQIQDHEKQNQINGGKKKFARPCSIILHVL